ncbi:AMP-dependent synthetase/ligase [Metarhizium album ARSEF 1941]|uniref:AMP-dependent synthetase/ligase n=1 Tax=Metarhizium album (strain ARSEF 1941) TaxID=1081103 RepID=A0A0B2WMT1_METAS|nr:AMP-dependent synthetase/ligase [Metarhizium album ARSEF 1941]KHN94310.1 AMP-dependent synthetase/ligase [Metarhizium album ARSEF 1941]
MALVTEPLLSQAFGGCSRQPQPQPPIWERLQDAAARHRTRLAVVSLHQPKDLYVLASRAEESCSTHLRWSYGTLTAMVERLATGLTSRGLRRGDTIVTYLYNGVEFVMSFWAAHQLGCPFVPLNPESLLNREESAHVLGLVTPSVVIVNDNTTAERMDAVLGKRFELTTRSIAGSDDCDVVGWTCLQSVLAAPGEGMKTRADTLSSPLHHRIGSTSTETDLESKPVTVLFTSGTTALPKGVPHTNATLNAFSENLSLGGTSESNIFCSVLPNNHAIGYFFALHFMMSGAAIVYPSSKFDPDKTIDAMESEMVTHTALVPTTLHRLAESLGHRSMPFRSSLADVCIAGDAIIPDDLRYIADGLQSTGVSTGFGMTEGSPVWSAPLNPNDLIDENTTFAGYPSPGASVKICSPGSRVPLALGEVGELHQSGPGLVDGYLGGDDASEGQFYQDNAGRTWFMTGDQAVMHPSGRISVTGRYKDIINRGGLNISPAAMEAVIKRACSESVQVIGVPDEFAGSVPIVVCEDAVQATVDEIRNAIVAEIGPKCSPVDVVKLRQLGLDDFPRTSSGKVQKSKLSSVYLKQKKMVEIRSCSAKSSHEDCLLQAYSQATGINAKELDRDLPVSLFADSIVAMRVRDYVRKHLGVSISARDMADHETLNSQIALLQKHTSNTSRGLAETRANTNEPEKPFSVADLASTWPSPETNRHMQTSLREMVETSGFRWPEDVSAVTPAHDFLQVLVDARIIDTWNFAMAFQTTSPTTDKLGEALRIALANNPILTSFYAGYPAQHGAYVTVRPSPKLWEQCISTEAPVKSCADLATLALEYPYKDHARLPGPLFHALLVYVEEAKSAAIVYYVHHLAHDASSMRNFLADLDHVLASPGQKPRAHTDFKAWADSYHALRHSPSATLSVDYHVQRLRDLHKHKDGLYPLAPLPRKASEEGPDGLDSEFDAPGLVNLKAKLPGIGAATVLKAAMALVSTSRTGHSHAVFNNLEAGRGQFPFVPASVRAMDAAMYESADVNGPTMETACNLIEVLPHEPARDFLSRLQRDQARLTEHCHAPLWRVLERLREEGSGSDETMMEVHRSQLLTWVPGLMGQFRHLKMSRIAIRCDAGLVIVSGIGGPKATTYTFSLRWDVANYSRQQAAEYLEHVQAAIQFLTSEEHWDDDVGTVLEKMKR